MPGPHRGREDYGGAAQLNKARVPQRSCGFALPADAVLALVLNLNLGLLAKLCVCIPFLPGKRAAILILEAPAERDERFVCALRRPANTDRLAVGPHTTSFFLLFGSFPCVFTSVSSCPRVLTGETLRRLLWEKRAGRTASGNAGCAIGTASKRQLRRPALPPSCSMICSLVVFA